MRYDPKARGAWRELRWKKCVGVRVNAFALIGANLLVSREFSFFALLARLSKIFTE